MISRYALGLLPILASLAAVGCSEARAAETTGESELASSAGATQKYVCELTTSFGAKEEATVEVNGAGKMAVTRAYTFNGRVSNGSIQGLATVSTGNLTDMADSQGLRTYRLAHVALSTNLDGSNPRLFFGGEPIPCHAE